MVDRYEFEVNVVESKYGDYVSHDDYLALESQFEDKELDLGELNDKYNELYGEYVELKSRMEGLEK